jgi:hypothetical protein
MVLNGPKKLIAPTMADRIGTVGEVRKQTASDEVAQCLMFKAQAFPAVGNNLRWPCRVHIQLAGT